MADPHRGSGTIDWYRTPMPPETLKHLNSRSDLLGFLQAGGFFAYLCCTAALAIYSWAHWPWYATVALVFFHGMGSNFYINGVHELCHNTVFKSKALNGFFIRLLGFFGWCDWVWFTASHSNHHRYTLHPPRDGEVVLPIKGLGWKMFWMCAIVNYNQPRWMIGGTLAKARGKLEGEWSQALFPADKPEALRKLVNWNRFVLGGHALITVVSLAMGWWIVPIVVCLGPCFGGWLFYLVNNTQHVGLTDKVPDFRLCCRSMKLPWPVSFLYWHMQYHTEHHMYAAVPCYRLRALNRQIRADLPEPKGILGTWREIAMILKRQETEPDYQYQHPLPASATPANFGDREAEIAAGAAQPDVAVEEPVFA